MKLLFIIATTLSAALIAGGCEKNGPATDENPLVTPQAKAALIQKYPSATDIAWRAKGDYLVADFGMTMNTAAGRDRTAWLDGSGEWYMTETDIAFDALPEKVRAAFAQSEYASWRVDDADMLERRGAETMYVIEVEKNTADGKVEADIYYTADGVQVKAVIDAAEDYDYDDCIPDRSESGIDSFLAARYPDARILDVDREGNLVEVEIIDGNVCRELLFNGSGEWIRTKTEIRRSDLPANVAAALSASAYAAYLIDDVDHFLTPKGEFYRIELKSGSGDIKVDITPEGGLTVVDSSAGDGGNGDMVKDGVREFISGKYPSAVIRETDYDDGFMQVEIMHEGREKEVYFNGAGQWVRTEWDVLRRELPELVAAAVAKAYPSHAIDDIEAVDTPAGFFYLIELESGSGEMEIRIDASGNIL